LKWKIAIKEKTTMKKSRIWSVPVLLGVGMIIAYSMKSQPKVFAQSTSCSITNLNATYGFSFEGFASSRPPQTPLRIDAFSPVAAAGTITFGPSGILSRSFNVSLGKVISPVADSGSYSINPDCTFTAYLPEVGETWNLVPVNGGKQIEFSVNTAGRVGAGILTQQ
jgi:hypothetical protein